MSDITVVEVAGELVVDSRLIAEQLDIEHKSFIKLIRKHQVKIEAKFGTMRFEISASEMPDGRPNPNPSQFVWLNEGQATALLTLCRNTERVVDLKFDLVEKFQAQKKQLENPIDRTLLVDLAQRVTRLESLSISVLPSGSSVPEMTRSAQVKELVYHYVDKINCDYEAAWQLLYRKFGLLYSWRPNPQEQKEQANPSRRCGSDRRTLSTRSEAFCLISD
jgi:phage regulator Rha-like protein